MGSLATHLFFLAKFLIKTGSAGIKAVFGVVSALNG